MTFIDAFVVVVVLVILGVYVTNKMRDVSYVKSSVDGKEYLVRSVGDALEAADMLARLNAKAMLLISRLSEAHGDDERVALLSRRYNPSALSEGSHESGYTSYSVNKGQRIVMCLRSRGDSVDKLEDENTLMYVLTHELAHLATDEVGHTPRFWENFRFLVKRAVEYGVYKDRDYSAHPVNYCGIKIDSSAITKAADPPAAR